MHWTGISTKIRIMAKTGAQKVTSPRAASAASKVLRSNTTSKAAKTAAGSALAQTPSRRSHR